MADHASDAAAGTGPSVPGFAAGDASSLGFSSFQAHSGDEKAHVEGTDSAVTGKGGRGVCKKSHKKSRNGCHRCKARRVKVRVLSTNKSNLCCDSSVVSYIPVLVCFLYREDGTCIHDSE